MTETRMPTADLPELCQTRDLMRLFGNCSRSSVESYIRTGIIPAPIMVTKRRRLWPRAEIVAAVRALEARVAAERAERGLGGCR